MFSNLPTSPRKQTATATHLHCAVRKKSNRLLTQRPSQIHHENADAKMIFCNAMFKSKENIADDYIPLVAESHELLGNTEIVNL